MRLAVLVVALAACNPYDPALDDTPFFCGSGDPQCPDGYACMQRASGSAVCTKDMTGSGSGSGSGSGTCSMAFTGTVATWDMTGAIGSQPSSAVTDKANGITGTPLTRSAALMATQASNSISASGWPSSTQPDPGAYFTLTIAPPSGCMLDLTGLMIDVLSSGTGPAAAAVATSDSAFMTKTPISTTTPTTVPLSVTNASGVLELRVFGYAASATTGTMRIQNKLSLAGAVH